MCGKNSFSIISKYHQHILTVRVISESYWSWLIWSVPFDTLMFNSGFVYCYNMFHHVFTLDHIYICVNAQSIFPPVFDKKYGTLLVIVFFMPSCSTKLVNGATTYTSFMGNIFTSEWPICFKNLSYNHGVFFISN